MKKKWTRVAAEAARAQGFKPIKEPAWVSCVWYEGDRRRDLDNVSAAIKFVFDGLVDAGLLVDDSQKWIRAISHEVMTTTNKSYGVDVRFSGHEVWPS